MTVLGRVLRRGDTQRSVSFQDIWGAGGVWPTTGSAAGPAVTEESALRLSTVYACVRLIAENTSSLPVDTFLRRSGVRTPFRPRPVWLDAPNPEQTRMQVLDQTFTSLLLHGNAFWTLVRDRFGDVIEVWPLHPSLVEPERDRSTGEMRYRVQTSDTGESRTVGPEDMLHIAGLMVPGQLRGLSPLAYARDVIGLGLATQEFGSRFFGNGAHPGGVIEVPKEYGELSTTAVAALKAAWNEQHGGASRSGKTGVLTAGMTYRPISVPPDDAQFLETRQFQVNEVCRIFGVPPHLVADVSGSTSWGTGIEEQSIGFVTFTLRPWVERIEAAIQRILPAQPQGVFVKFNFDSLVRTNLRDRYDAHAVALQNGWLSINEVRRLEDLPPISGGDEYLRPLNQGTVGNTPAATTPEGGTA